MLEDRLRILVVEDERKVASFIRQGLAEEGHTVEVAADGDDRARPARWTGRPTIWSCST